MVGARVLIFAFMFEAPCWPWQMRKWEGTIRRSSSEILCASVFDFFQTAGACVHGVCLASRLLRLFQRFANCTESFCGICCCKISNSFILWSGAWRKRKNCFSDKELCFRGWSPLKSNTHFYPRKYPFTKDLRESKVLYLLITVSHVNDSVWGCFRLRNRLFVTFKEHIRYEFLACSLQSVVCLALSLFENRCFEFNVLIFEFVLFLPHSKQQSRAVIRLSVQTSGPLGIWLSWTSWRRLFSPQD